MNEDKERRFNFQSLLNRKVSVLIAGKSDKKETYVGVVSDVYEDFVELRCKCEESSTFPLSSIIIRKDLILSIWIYREGK
jgi:hypothetical protein